jgi:hypothetical protein
MHALQERLLEPPQQGQLDHLEDEDLDVGLFHGAAM